MSRALAWFVDLSALVVGVTGVVYGWMRYFCEPVDEFAIVNHPLEPAFKAWHIVLAPLLVFAVGVVWRGHVWLRIRTHKRERRTTGLVLAVLVLPMIASGYLVQTAVEETWRIAWVWIHAVTSTLWIALYAVHRAPDAVRLFTRSTSMSRRIARADRICR